MNFWLNFFSASSAAAAAILWFYASTIRAPETITSIIVGTDGFGGELPELFAALARQSKWNARAAIFAGLAAALQAAVIFLV